MTTTHDVNGEPVIGDLPGEGRPGPRAARGTSTTEGRVFTVTGGDWDDMLAEGGFGDPDSFESDERIIVNMGPQHPSTHGVLRLILEIEGETVVQARTVIGYLHTGIEKSCEYRNFTQGVTFVTRADYLSPAFNEAVYCMAIEKQLGNRGAAARPCDQGAAHGADQDFLAPGRGGHRRHGTRCVDRHDDGFPGTGGSPAPDGVPDRVADEHGLHSAGRGRPGVAGGFDRAHQRVHRQDGEPAARVRQTADRPTGLEDAHEGRRHPPAGGVHATGHHRPGAAVHRVATGTCARSEPYCGYENYEFDVITDFDGCRFLRRATSVARERDVTSR